MSSLSHPQEPEENVMEVTITFITGEVSSQDLQPFGMARQLAERWSEDYRQLLEITSEALESGDYDVHVTPALT